ncbi:MAG: bifunctional nuclease domain-containing protein [Acidimicrobiales bacterium]
MTQLDGCHDSDAHLVASALQGDKAAFGTLVARNTPMARSVTMRLLRDPVLTADVLQEATLASYLGLSRLRSPGRFGSWYTGIALNIARRSVQRIAAEPLSDDVVEVAAGPDEQAEAAEMARRVGQAVQLLPAGQRDAVLAFYWQGLSHAEAALELGIQPGAVKARLHQARESLAHSLAGLVDHTGEDRVSSDNNDAYVDASIVEIRSLAADDPVRRTHVITFQEHRGERRLVVFVGGTEGRAMVSTLEAVEFPRPMTYQLCANLIEATESTLVEVRLTDFTDHTYLAEIVLRTGGGSVHIDARPSDAINLALVTGAPMRIADVLFDTWASEVAHTPFRTIEEAIGGPLEGEWVPRWQPPG